MSFEQEQRRREPEKEFPVDERHDIGGEKEHGASWYSLVKWKCLQYQTIIAKLCQHHFVKIDQQWTGCVAIILDTQTDIHTE